MILKQLPVISHNGFLPAKRASVILIVILFSVSCHRNHLKVDEEKLKMEMKESMREDVSGSTVQGANGQKIRFSLRELRKVDENNPPQIVDIAGNLQNTEDLGLSDIAERIEYIRLDPVPDSTLPASMKYRYYLTDDYLIAVNLFGIHVYSKDGKFIRSVVRNEYTGMVIQPGLLFFYNDFTLRGGGTSVQVDGNTIYYLYTNTNLGQKYIMKYDCSSMSLLPDYRFDPEDPDKISGLGEIQIDLNHGKNGISPSKSGNGMFGGSSDFVYYMHEPAMLGSGQYTVPLHGDSLMAVLNPGGDTLTAFTKSERLLNYTKSMQRGTDAGSDYEYNGARYIRSAFNDTLFRIIPPNVLMPVYVINLGGYKVSMQEGVDPDFSLEGKIIPWEWAETEKYIFVTFTRDSYDCPNNRKNKSVKIFHALFNKQTTSLVIIKGDPYDYQSEILINDIDGGVPVWPRSYMTGAKGEILISLKGSELISRVRGKEFRNSVAPETGKKALEKFASSLSPSDDILMKIVLR